MGLKVTIGGDGFWTVTGYKNLERRRYCDLTEAKARENRWTDADYLEPVATLCIHPRSYPCREDTSPEDVGAVHLSWNGFYNRTIKDLSSEFEDAKKKWEKKGLRTLKALFSKTMEDNKVQITNIVALGIGSLHASWGLPGIDAKDVRWHEYKMNSQKVTHDQLATVMTLAEMLGEERRPLSCVVQDPAYSTIEKEYLRSLGLDCVDDPDAFSRINNGTLVFAIRTSWWICEEISEGVWPAALLCTNFSDRDEWKGDYPGSEKVKSMVKDCEEQLLECDWGEVNLYWRRAA